MISKIFKKYISLIELISGGKFKHINSHSFKPVFNIINPNVGHTFNIY
jgi:hypothetical protein